MASTSTARRDINRQRATDSNREGIPAMFFARVRSVLEAHDAIAAGEEGALPALRQSYVDVAAAAELLAADIPAEPAD